MLAAELKRDLQKLVKPGKNQILARFFKTGPGQYGAGDKFLGVMVPEQRKVALKYEKLSLAEVQKLLNSPWHEHRLTALLILVKKMTAASDEKTQKVIVDFYTKNTHRINNWDLVDLSADKILGKYFFSRPTKILDKFVRSKNLWERRIAVLTTFYFIKQHDFSATLKLAKILLTDQEDLIQKAVGWMLREVGKRELAVEIKFLNQYSKLMPRTMLRYAIEKFPEAHRQKYLLK